MADLRKSEERALRLCGSSQIARTRADFERFSEMSEILKTAKLRGKDLNLRPPGYEPGELPDCSTPLWQCIRRLVRRSIRVRDLQCGRVRILIEDRSRPCRADRIFRYGFELRSAFPVARSTGTEMCSCEISHLPSRFSYPSVTRVVKSCTVPLAVEHVSRWILCP